MWHEARRSEKKVHDMMDAARKRAQRRAVYLAKRRKDPHQSIQVISNRCRIYRDDGLYLANQDEQGLIPWNGKEDVLIDRFDGRALLDFIRESGSRKFRRPERSDEEEALEEFVNFERYRDLIKHRRRGFSDDEGLQYVDQQLEAKVTGHFASDSAQRSQPAANKGTYSQVGFSYDRETKEDGKFSDGDEEEEEEEDEDDEVDEEFNSDDSNDEGIEKIAKEYGVKRFGWLIYMDKKAKEEEKRQKEIIKGDPAIRKLSRKERRKASQIERERERVAARNSGSRVLHHDPYRESRRSPTYEAYSRANRSRSRSHSPLHLRRHGRGHSDDVYHSKPKAPKIEYITEFGSSGSRDEFKLEGYSPPSSPALQADTWNRISSGRILEAIHVDPASGAPFDKDKSTSAAKQSASSSTALAKLTKSSTLAGLQKQSQGEKKETPQERLKRIMSKQLNKQIKKDTAAEIAKKGEQQRMRLEKLEETSRLDRSHSYSRSPPRRRRRSRSPNRSSRRYHSRSFSRSLSRSGSRSGSRSRSRSRSNSRNSSRSLSSSRSPRY